ncbi:MAG: hypothetical protein AAF623_20430, partial [Planctomycetota bacterium]
MTRKQFRFDDGGPKTDFYANLGRLLNRRTPFYFATIEPVSWMTNLEKNQKFNGPEGPVILVIMDGVGIGKGDSGDMVHHASTPTLDWLKSNAIYTQLKAHGLAVGMPSDGDMGNSEVGHNAIGAGRVFDQGALLVKNSAESGAMFEGQTWKELTENLENNTLHLLGLLSDGNVHSHIDILMIMIRQAHSQGIQKVRVH